MSEGSANMSGGGIETCAVAPDTEILAQAVQGQETFLSFRIQADNLWFPGKKVEIVIHKDCFAVHAMPV